ncbi:hypothetical protein [Catenulispora acidiphila]|uniref:hypothetical protein n=1 Tax=Catenulispora acidiphila TaxID=304895 RepID=UPI00117C8466|nr:hypothetical protein [Catenulispora acidiphila]
MTVLRATARFYPEGLTGPLPNPYPEMMIGDPKAGTVFRCVLHLDDAEAIEPGACGPARVDLLWNLVPDWPEPWLLWHGRIIGELTGLAPEDPPSAASQS